MPLKPGDRIDRYVIDGPLGSGGMGEVYRAHDSRLKRAVALKILHTESSAPDPNAKTSAPMSNPGARMLREAQLAASLDHPNVVAIFDVGQLEAPPELCGTTYLAMELIRGEPLRKYVGDATVKMKVRVRWLEEIARALGAAHSAGLVHRDVKPENVMIREDGIVKVLDFGIAKRTTATIVDPTSSTEGYAVPTMTQQGAVVGTPFYMAPEQLKAEKLDGRADQFAWGVVAYELLTGKPLWSLEGGGYSLVAQILQAPPPSMAAFAGVPERVARTVARALAKDAASRFATMQELVEELTGRAAGDTDRPPTLSPATSSPDVAGARSVEQVSGAVSSGVQAPEAATKRSARPGTLPSPALPTPDPMPAPAPPAPHQRRWTAATGAAIAVLLVLGGGMALRARSTPAPLATSAAPDAAIAVAAGECRTNAECVRANGGKPSVCHRNDGTCAALTSEDCEVRADKAALEADDTVWIGTLFPLKGQLADDFGRVESEGVELARRDFAEVLGGMTAPGEAHVRPLGLVSCDDSVDAARAANHLVADVHVPAVIGFGRNAEGVHLAESVFMPAHTLVMSSVNTSPMLTSIPVPGGGPRLIWRSMFSTTQEGGPLAALVASILEPRVRSTKDPHDPVRVALVRIRTMAELAFSETLQRALTFNGKTALQNGSSFGEFVVDDPFAPDAGPDFEGTVSKLLAFAPDIVLFDSPDALAKTVFVPLEQRWPAGAHRPLYASASSIPREFVSGAGKSAERRHRFFGLTTVSTTATNARLVVHFNETFGDKVTRTVTPNGSYDAFYVLAYASVAASGEPVSGPTLSRALTRLMAPGEPIDVGPLEILKGYAALARGGNIDLDGALGHLDFDPKTGEEPVDMAVLCVGVDRSGAAADVIESGLVYDARGASLKGDMSCP